VYKTVKQTLSSLAALLVIFIAVTVLALESSEVITVETVMRNVNESSGIRRTHIWFVQTQTGVFLEAGSPTNPWVRDLRENPRIVLAGADLEGSYHATLDTSSIAHKNIRKLMREKYGWRDWWVDMLFDTSKSQLVTLTQL